MQRILTFLLSFGLLLAPGVLLAQESATASPALGCAAVTGSVTDEEANPLLGATVQVPGINDAFISNSEGHYIIVTKTPLPKNTRLTISAGGYESQELVVSGCELPNVSLRVLPGTRFKRDGRIKKTSSTGKIW